MTQKSLALFFPESMSPRRAEEVLRHLATIVEGFDAAVILTRAADHLDHVAGGSILDDRYEKQLVAFVAELYRNRRGEIAAYLLANPEACAQIPPERDYPR